MRTKHQSTDGTYGQEASKQGLIMPPTFKHMNPQDKKIDTRNPKDLSDIEKLNAGALDALRSKGMIVNEADTNGFRKPLGAFYARWKENYGTKAWALLEARVGKLV